ncbi:ATP-binding protein [Granulicella sibirica]|uniref:ATP-binding protein n=1 Tax=Granulicella sibirica TaxID=2479048 RepID=UPI00186412F2|nr:ATP-binding protein [Granulicella sibirica]
MFVFITIVVFASEMLFVRIAFFEDRWAVWWPGNGIAMGTLLLIRRRHRPWVLTEAHESLGLWLSREIMKRCGSSMQVRSAVQRGTVFHLSLERVDPESSDGEKGKGINAAKSHLAKSYHLTENSSFTLVR